MIWVLIASVPDLCMLYPFERKRFDIIIMSNFGKFNWPLSNNYQCIQCKTMQRS